MRKPQHIPEPRMYRYRGTIEAYQWKPPDPVVPAWLKTEFKVIASPGGPLKQWRAVVANRIVRPGEYITRHDLKVWKKSVFEKTFEKVK